MVHKIRDKKYWIFIDALVIAGAIFIIGFSTGFLLENLRLNKIIDNYRDNEIESLDLKLQNYYYQIMDSETCDSAIEQNFIFADKIYEEGLKIARFEEANQITDSLKIEKKRYVLLKTELWLNSLLLKEKCGDRFDTVVYFYEDNAPSSAKNSEQKIISNVLKDVKNEKRNSIILLPIAGDLDLDIVNLQKEIHNVTYLPSILINEETLLEGFHSQEEIEQYLN